MKITMTPRIERQRARLYTQKAKNAKSFYIKKPHTFQKARHFPLRFYIQKDIHLLTLQDLHEIFEVGIYTKSLTLFVT